jgi:hypothetical protein
MAGSETKRHAEYRSIVIRYRPGQQLAAFIGLLILIALLAVVSYRTGAEMRHSNYQHLLAQKAQLAEQLQARKVELQEAEQRQVNLEVAAQVDRLAVEDIRQSLIGLEEKLAELMEENTFYKGLMAPSELDRGLSVRGWSVTPLQENNRFAYKLVVQQLAAKHRLLKGAATVYLVGKQAAKPRTLSLHLLSEQLDNEQVKLRFKYFQAIEGELTLPEDFVPEQVKVVVSSSKPKTARVEKQYAWSDQ